MNSWEAIANAMQQRRAADTDRFTRMIQVRDRANGDMVIPLPDVSGEPSMEPPSPRLILDAIDSTAMQAGGSTPTIFCPPLDPTKNDGIKSNAYAAIRRRACYASWHYSAVDLLLLRYFRHLSGYGTGAMIVMPDYEQERARIELRDPLTSYPEMRSPDDIREPINVGFVFGRSADFIRAHYPAAKDWVTRQNNQLWDMVEWIDEDDIVIGLLGPRFPSSIASGVNREPSTQGLELRRWKNKAGMVPVAIPRRVTLDKIMGQVDTIIGSVDLLTRLSALEVIAAERAVFPDMQVIGAGGRPPTLVGGEWKDGRTGEANVVIDGEARYLVSSVGPATFQTMANLERNIRLSSGNSSVNQGEYAGSLRSGQTVNALAGFSINPRVQEAHMIAQRSLSVINAAVMATEKGCWPKKKFFVFSGQGGEAMVEYVPEKHFETFENSVSYSFAGMDLSQITVAVAQMNASGLISKTTARSQHPLIVDAEFEEQKVNLERIDEAVINGLLQGLASGQIPPIDGAAIKRALAEGRTIEDAIDEANRAAQERQAAQAPPPGEGQVTPPEVQPGLGAPGQGVEQQQIPGINPDQERLARANFLLQAGRR